jgi:mono/diheme cytochrome c family protein
MKTVALPVAVVLSVIFLQTGSSRGQNVPEGKKLYAANCSSCHGDIGKGDGVAGRALPAKPADHTDGAFMNKLTDQWLYDIISKGGGAVGKSNFMPGWSGSLNEKQIRDLLAYIRSLAEPPYGSDRPAGK